MRKRLAVAAVLRIYREKGVNFRLPRLSAPRETIAIYIHATTSLLIYIYMYIYSYMERLTGVRRKVAPSYRAKTHRTKRNAARERRCILKKIRCGNADVYKRCTNVYIYGIGAKTYKYIAVKPNSFRLAFSTPQHSYNFPAFGFWLATIGGACALFYIPHMNLCAECIYITEVCATCVASRLVLLGITIIASIIALSLLSWQPQYILHAMPNGPLMLLLLF